MPQKDADKVATSADPDQTVPLGAVLSGATLFTQSYLYYYMSRVMRKPTFWFLTWSDTNQTVQLLKMARSSKFQIYEVEGLYYLCRL